MGEGGHRDEYVLEVCVWALHRGRLMTGVAMMQEGAFSSVRFFLISGGIVCHGP